MGPIIAPWHRSCFFWNVFVFQNIESCPLSICGYIYFHCMYLLMITVCHDYFFIVLKVPVCSGPFFPLVCIPGIQRSCSVPILLSASQLLNELACFVVLLINNCILYCFIILEPLHVNSILICCDPRYIFNGFRFRICLLMPFSPFWLLKSCATGKLFQEVYLQLLLREFHTVLSNYFLAFKLRTKTGSDVFS